ncbi:MAG: hypothetical protein VXV97_10105 [Pseudomonadota bacterium]|nr:hypothetical protein [Pseudomonadota bacterium]
MAKLKKIVINTKGSGLYEITDDLKRLRDHGYRSTIFRYPAFDIAEQNRQFDILADKIMTKI